VSTSDTRPPRPPLPPGLVAFVKRDCETCQLVDPLLGQLGTAEPVTVYTQDDLAFPTSIGAIDDLELEMSWHHDIETVPTLMRVGADGVEQERIVGWSRDQWQAFTGNIELGITLPEFRPGCGSLSVDPSRSEELNARMGGSGLATRRVEFASLEDDFEAMFDRGWSDGLPLVPPTEARVMRMLEGTTRAADEVVANVAPDLVDVTVEKVAVNAVMAGCKPEYLPVVLAAIEAMCTDEFNIHGLLATTMSVGPVFVEQFSSSCAMWAEVGRAGWTEQPMAVPPRSAWRSPKTKREHPGSRLPRNEAWPRERMR